MDPLIRSVVAMAGCELKIATFAVNAAENNELGKAGVGAPSTKEPCNSQCHAGFPASARVNEAHVEPQESHAYEAGGVRTADILKLLFWIKDANLP